MREILFRGKRVDNGEWVEGFYIEDKWGDSNGNELHGILQDRTCPPGLADWIPVPVQKETVGQYTGLTDKNGKKIFEGDILKFKTKKLENVAVGYGKSGYICKVKTSTNTTTFFNLQHFLEKYNCKVIGNIHDNPELLEVEE